MSAYRSLLSVSVRHDFFVGPAGCGLHFVPTAKAADWLRRSGCLVRAEVGRVLVLHDGSPWSDRGAAQGVTLDFLIHATDPLIHNVTEDLPADASLVAHFDSSPDVAAEGGAVETLRRSADRSRPGLPLGAALPCMAVTLRLRPADLVTGRHWLLPLAARRTTWKYLFAGPWTNQTMEVVDLAGEITFERAEDETLTDGTLAVAIRSRSRIAIGERAVYQFQLRRTARARNEDPVLVDRLPLASAHQFALERRGSESALVSEILVHR
jgi:hypothetical protein